MHLERLNTSDVCELVQNGRIHAKVVNSELKLFIDELDAHSLLRDMVAAARCSDYLIQDAMQKYIESNDAQPEPIIIDLHVSMLSNHDFIESAIAFVDKQRFNLNFNVFGTDSTMSKQITTLIEHHVALLVKHNMLTSESIAKGKNHGIAVI
ncbi:hypothetical protein ENFAE_00100 [Enterococcus faecalis]|uniref:hypothetical protein n=1 Tax=Enterococcus faecalis TaxID=1351 RepID=UPI00087873A9|nr:hypothetical protein [Enterococcus faecalis]OFA14788.1 hypothetical protein ENFAE_00100 [Enterococcus faecalis]